MGGHVSKSNITHGKESTLDADTISAPPVRQTFAVEQDWLYIKALRFGAVYQRPIDHPRVVRLARNFDLDALGTIEVSRRKDGSFWIIDGQHRVSALIELGFGDDRVPCLIHSGLTIEEEAKIYRLRNTAVRPNSYAMFRAELAEQGPEAVDIDRIVRRCGLNIQMGGGRGNVMAVSALRKCYRHAGALTLERTLRIILAAWGADSTNFQADLLVGLAIVQKRYGDDLDRERLVKVLADTTSQAIVAKGRAMKLNQGSLGLTTIPELVVALYNKNLRKAKLPEWERRTNVREVWS